MTLSGVLEHRSAIAVAVRLTQGVDGVVEVINKLTYEIDDTHGRLASRGTR
ncbi:BON domain-containing protein [Streptomyces sp. RB6PN25]|uniref:BON domain-containing protein n=1 Tax=Streptomyces humicola TaxID=2953240 RepID=A0ABT1Q3E0_9ACTN|nr:BON domain-containing protein [Streptomyces humicola]MCQ4083903.1 BON domain-containing protein [Streptomyces humicola]